MRDLVDIDCMAGSDHYHIVMELDDPIDEYPPGLAASLAGCTYIHGTGVIYVAEEGRRVAIYSRRINITDVISWLS